MSSRTSQFMFPRPDNFPRSHGHPCGVCKTLRRRCEEGCIFAPYFPSNDTQKFKKLHNIFGAGYIGRLLSQVHPNLREKAVDSLLYCAENRLMDPVCGCLLHVLILESNIKQLKDQLELMKRELATYQMMFPMGAPHGGLQPQNDQFFYGVTAAGFDQNPTAASAGPAQPSLAGFTVDHPQQTGPFF